MSNNLRTVFLSHPLSPETVGYGGKKTFQTSSTLSMQKGDSCNQSEWHLSNHIGTHIDVPFHFSNSGKKLDSYSADFWIFSTPYLVHLPASASVIIEKNSWSDLIPKTSDLLLIKTDFEKFRDSEDYWAHNPGLSPALGLWLREHRPAIRAIGFDFMSITSYDHRALGKQAHHAFLHEQNVGTPIVAIEDMHLAYLTTQPKRVIVSPLRVREADGSPVTVFAEL